MKFIFAQICLVLSLASASLAQSDNNSLSPTIEVPDQGLEVGEFGQLALRDLPDNHAWKLVMINTSSEEIWKKEIPAEKKRSKPTKVNLVVPFVIPDSGEYEIRLLKDGKWIIRIYLLSENNRLWIGESLHEAVLNMLGIMRTTHWYGSPTSNLPIDDPKFMEWISKREQDIIRQIAATP